MPKIAKKAGSTKKKTKATPTRNRSAKSKEASATKAATSAKSKSASATKAATSAESKTATSAKPKVSKPKATRKPTRRKPSKRVSDILISANERRRLIAEAAYLRAEARGFVGGDPTRDWLEAENEVDARIAPLA